MEQQSPRTFIFIGPSGCGKGTQVKLLREYLSKIEPSFEQFYLQTGHLFREFVKGDTFAAKISYSALNRGERQPDFLAMWVWADTFIKNLHGNEHLIIDGSPRSMNEATNLDIAMKFFRRERPIVIYMNVSHDWALVRMLQRAKEEGRADDTEDAIRKRLAWYENDVAPVVEHYRNDTNYDFFEVEGEKEIIQVHEEIISKVFNSK